MPASKKPPGILREPAPTPSVKRSRRGIPRQQALLLAPTPDSAASPLPENVTSYVTSHAASRLWFCIFMPALPLEALSQAGAASAVFEEVKGIRKILLANEAAFAAGVRPGLSINAALALKPTLCLKERSLNQEMQALQEVAE